jgi:hypothetical protein
MKYPRFYEILKFITAFMCLQSVPILSQNNPVHAPTFQFLKIVILYSHLCPGIPSGSFPQFSPPVLCVILFPSPYVPHAPPSSFVFVWWKINETITNNSQEIAKHFNDYFLTVADTVIGDIKNITVIQNMTWILPNNLLTNLIRHF